MAKPRDSCESRGFLFVPGRGGNAAARSFRAVTRYPEIMPYIFRYPEDSRAGNIHERLFIVDSAPGGAVIPVGREWARAVALSSPERGESICKSL